MNRFQSIFFAMLLVFSSSAQADWKEKVFNVLKNPIVSATGGGVAGLLLIIAGRYYTYSGIRKKQQIKELEQVHRQQVDSLEQHKKEMEQLYQKQVEKLKQENENEKNRAIQAENKANWHEEIARQTLETLMFICGDQSLYQPIQDKISTYKEKKNKNYLENEYLKTVAIGYEEFTVRRIDERFKHAETELTKLKIKQTQINTL